MSTSKSTASDQVAGNDGEDSLAHPRFGSRKRATERIESGTPSEALGSDSQQELAQGAFRTVSDGEVSQAPPSSPSPQPFARYSTFNNIGNAEATHSDSIAFGGSPIQPGQQQPDETDRYIQAGQELAALFKDRNVHPVIVVGGKGAGKTTLLASLLRYSRFTQDAGGTVSLMTDLYPAHDPIWGAQLQWARQLLEQTVASFDHAKGPAATRTAEPFFVPVTFTLRSGVSARVAFLESMGELYALDRTEKALSIHKPFHALLGSFLNSFTGGLSVLYVAPLIVGDAGADGAIEGSSSPGMLDSDQALFGVLEQYVNQRKGAYHRDRHLLLMTKWDVRFRSLSDPDLLDPPQDLIESVFQERYRKTWAQFHGLAFEGSSGNKRYSVYTAGAMRGDKVLATSIEDRPVVDRFPRKLWDWIWQGATGTDLYADMRPNPPNAIDKMIRWLRGSR
jgi:hypothetical protein